MMLQVRFSLIFLQIKFAYKYDLHLHVNDIFKKYCAITGNYLVSARLVDTENVDNPSPESQIKGS